MPGSTPISSIRREQDNSELVQNILQEMESGGGQQQQQQMGQQMHQQRQPQQKKYDDEEEYEEYFDDIVEHKQLSSTDMMISELKLPAIVVLLVFLTNFEVINKMIVTNIPKLASGGELTMTGIIFKAAIAGVIFYVVKKFFL